MIKAVIFDLDDTLIAEKDYIESGFNAVAKKIAKDQKKDFVLVIETILSEFKKNPENVFNRTLQSLEIPEDINYIKILIKTYREHAPLIKLLDDAKYIMTLLQKKEIPMGIITDGYKVAQRKKLEVLKISNYFEFIIVTDELGKKYWKPHQKSYMMAKEFLGIEFEEMAYIGDNVNKDFVTAKKLGMKTICVSRESGIYKSTLEVSKDYMPDIVVSNLYKLYNVLN